MHYKKLLATAVFTLGVWMSAGARADTYYDFTSSFSGGNAASGLYVGTLQVRDMAPQLIGQIIGVSGFKLNNSPIDPDSCDPNCGYVRSTSDFGIQITWIDLPIYRILQVDDSGGASWYINFTDPNPIFDVNLPSANTLTCVSGCSGVVPEMNASLIPQVGLLLGCLFFLMGRKREVVEPMLAA